MNIWWRGGKWKEKAGLGEHGVGVGGDNGCLRERKREGEKGKAGMHESLKQRPRSRERAAGDEEGGSVPKAL